MTKEEIVKELDELENVLYNKFGGDSFLERCTIHDLKAKIKALIIPVVVVPKGTLPNNCKVCGRTIEEMGKMTSMCGVSACPNY